MPATTNKPSPYYYHTTSLEVHATLPRSGMVYWQANYNGIAGFRSKKYMNQDAYAKLQNDAVTSQEVGSIIV